MVMFKDVHDEITRRRSRECPSWLLKHVPVAT